MVPVILVTTLQILVVPLLQQTSNIVITFHGTNYFFNNLATIDGGAVFAIASTSVNFIGTTFSHNSAGSAGGTINIYIISVA